MTIDDENKYLIDCAARHITNIEQAFNEAKLKFEAFKAKLSKDFTSF